MDKWDSIKQQVEENDGILTVTAEVLRDAHGAQKLGINIREQISKRLAGMGLGHIPDELPQYQHESVRLYKRGTPIGDLLEAAITPREQNDSKLLDYVGERPDYADIIEQIRELVAE